MPARVFATVHGLAATSLASRSHPNQDARPAAAFGALLAAVLAKVIAAALPAPAAANVPKTLSSLAPQWTR